LDLRARSLTYTKHLGVVIDSKLSWFQHVKEVTRKANKVKGFLQHNLHNCPTSVKANYYKSLVNPILEYAWAPQTEKDILSTESVQRRAARFVFNDYSFISSITDATKVTLADSSSLSRPFKNHCCV